MPEPARGVEQGEAAGWTAGRRRPPGPGMPISRQCPLESTRPGSPGGRVRHPDQRARAVARATVPAKRRGRGGSRRAARAVGGAPCAAHAGVVASPVTAVAPKSAMANVPTRGLFMWGVSSPSPNLAPKIRSGTPCILGVEGAPPQDPNGAPGKRKMTLRGRRGDDGTVRRPPDSPAPPPRSPRPTAPTPAPSRT